MPSSVLKLAFYMLQCRKKIVKNHFLTGFLNRKGLISAGLGLILERLRFLIEVESTLGKSRLRRLANRGRRQRIRTN